MGKGDREGPWFIGQVNGGEGTIKSARDWYFPICVLLDR